MNNILSKAREYSFGNNTLLLELFLTISFYAIVCGILGVLLSHRFVPLGDTARYLIFDILLTLCLARLPRQPLALISRILVATIFCTGTMSLAHLLIYESSISKFAIESIFETTQSEAFEFLSEYIATTKSAQLLLASIVYMLLARKLFKTIKLMEYTPSKIQPVAAAIVIAALLSVSGKFFFHHPNLVVYASLNSYYKEMKQLKSSHKARKSIKFSNVSTNNTDEKLTLMILIGESANRNHIGYAGYFRDTTPHIGADRDLIKFSDVISPDTHTIPSLRKVLLLQSKNETENFLNYPSLIQLLNTADYSTLWISNQSVNRDGTTGTKVIAQDATKAIFLNRAQDERKTAHYDDVVIPEIAEALGNAEPRKAIFVHLMGSHITYSLRFPHDFEYFQSTADIPDRPFRSPEGKQFINDYDNSIRYTDHVLEGILDVARKAPEPMIVIYFSDHGQEVYDSRAIHGHATNDPSKHMYEIPFFVYLSDSFRHLHPEIADRIQRHAALPATTANFIHGIADILGIQFDGYDPTKSMFSDSYAAGTRKASNGADYDSLPK